MRRIYMHGCGCPVFLYSSTIHIYSFEALYSPVIHESRDIVLRINHLAFESLTSFVVFSLLVAMRTKNAFFNHLFQKYYFSCAFYMYTHILYIYFFWINDNIPCLYASTNKRNCDKIFVLGEFLCNFEFLANSYW